MALTLFININELTNEQYEREINFLCPQKRERVSRMRFEDDKKRSLAANLAARRASADFLGIDEDEIRITCDGQREAAVRWMLYISQSFRQLCSLCGEQFSNRS